MTLYGPRAASYQQMTCNKLILEFYDMPILCKNAKCQIPHFVFAPPLDQHVLGALAPQGDLR